MFRGSTTVKIDTRGRLKVPTNFFRGLVDQYGPEIYVTSFDGDSAHIYPLPVWEGIEERIGAMPATSRARRRLLLRTSYYGQQLRLDAQGRLVIPPILRENADMNGDVVVSGELDHLVIWNRQRLERRLAEEPLDDDDLAILNEHGI